MRTPRRRTVASPRARVRRPTVSRLAKVHHPTVSRLAKVHHPTASRQDRAHLPMVSLLDKDPRRTASKVRRPTASRQAGMVRPAPDPAGSARLVECVRHLVPGACPCPCRVARPVLVHRAGQWGSRRAGPPRLQGTVAPARRRRKGRCRRPSLARRARSGGSSARALRLPVTVD